MRRARLLIASLLIALLTGCADDEPISPGDPPHVKPPLLNHAPPDLTAVVDVNNLTLNLEAHRLLDGWFNGYRVLFAGSLAYGEYLSATYFYDTRNGINDRWGLYLPVEVVDEPPFADHQTLSLSAEWPTHPARERLGLLAVRETFAFAGDDFIFVKYTLFNSSDEIVAGLHVGQVLDADLGYAPLVGHTDDIVEFLADHRMALVTSTDPPLVFGHMMLSGNVTSYRSWRNPSTPGPLPTDPATWNDQFEFLSGGIIHPEPFGPSDVRHLLSEGEYYIPPGQSEVVAFALIAAEDEEALWDNVDAVWSRISGIPEEAGDPYPISMVELAIEPRVINLAAPSPIVAAFTFESSAQAEEFDPGYVRCGGAAPIRRTPPAGRTVRAFFNRSDIDTRWKNGEEIICTGKLSGGALYVGTDSPKLMRAIAPVTRLTSDPAVELTPTWSPDGKAIAFASNTNGSFAIYRMDIEAGAGSMVPLTSGADDVTPDWSPDGSRIAFTRTNDAIYWVPADAGSITPLTEEASYLPRYSPDGSLIVFQRTRDSGPAAGQHLWLMTADGEILGPDATLLTSGASRDFHPAWSADGALVYFASEYRPDDALPAIFAVDPDDGEPAARVTPIEGSDNRHPALSPDGRTLAFLSFSGQEWEVILQDLTTGEHSVLAFDLDLPLVFGGLNQQIEFSPDGQQLLFSAVITDNADIFVADISEFR
ncbi:MAG: PD40 domain-containing protein [Gemmatimonadota bacterium]|nr:MAG: PD40 domain-containing protein [Gemmatimonadota bacterium]